MSQIDVNQILAQMRGMAGAAKGGAAIEEQEPGGASFGQLLTESIAKVSQSQGKAAELAQSFESGAQGVDLPQVMVAVQEANISFQAMTQVRNKLLSAYQEIMNMQV